MAAETIDLTTDKVDIGLPGPAAGFGAVTAGVDDDGGAAGVDVAASGPDTAKNLDFRFHNLKGDKGDIGATPDVSLTATVGDGTGTPAVTVTRSGTAEAPAFTLAFDNLKGDKGDVGTTPDMTVTTTVGADTGTPTVKTTRTGTPESPSFALAFDGLKGEPGKPFLINDQIADTSKLPAAPATGDRYQTLDDMHVHEWNGAKWLDLGEFGGAATEVTATAPLTGNGTETDPLTIAAATASTLGVVRPGTGLTVGADGTLNATPGITTVHTAAPATGDGSETAPVTVQTATAAATGVVKPGDGMTITEDGSLNVTNQVTDDTISAAVAGAKTNAAITKLITDRISAIPPTAVTKVVTKGATLPIGLPAGSVVIEVADDSITFYEEDGK